MSPTHRLPAYLGGGECELITEFTNRRSMVEVAGRKVNLDTDTLTPLPPAEPPDLAVGRSKRDVWIRDDHPETEPGSFLEPGQHWWRAGDDRAYTWAGACEVIGADGLTMLAEAPGRLIAAVAAWTARIDLREGNLGAWADAQDRELIAAWQAHREARDA